MPDVSLSESDFLYLLNCQLGHHNHRMRQMIERNDSHGAALELGGVLGIEGAIKRLESEQRAAANRKLYEEEIERKKQVRAVNRETAKQSARLYREAAKQAAQHNKSTTSATGGQSDRKNVAA